MYKLVLFLGLIVLAHAAVQTLTNEELKALQALLAKMNGNPKTTTAAPIFKGQSSKYDSCITEDGKDGVCVPYYLCSNNTIITDGTNMTDIRGGECKYLHVCCIAPNTMHQENPKALSPSRPLTENKKPSTIVPPLSSRPSANIPCKTTQMVKNDRGTDLQVEVDGVCVLYYLCLENVIITDGNTIIDQRDGECPHLTVCCLFDNTTGLENPTEPPPNKPVTEEKKPSTIVPPIAKIPSTNGTCKTEDGEDGVCVPYYLCNIANSTVITDGIGLIDIRIGNRKCLNYLDMCCLPPDTRDLENPITPLPEKLPKREGCGWRNPDGIGMATIGDNDHEAKFGEFPWMVALIKFERVNNDELHTQKTYRGGGSLIHPSAVLTAAHYVADKKETIVRAGEWDTRTAKELYPYQERRVSQFEIHKDFNKGNLFYDIALLILSKPMDMAPNVGLACLPPPRELVADGTLCVASGWGKDKFNNKENQVILKKVEVPVVERGRCQMALRNTRLGHYFQLHSSFMCAGGELGKDTCKGDGGAPLMCPIETQPGRYMQSGIVAWGIGCGQDGTPGVYVDVSNLRSWIDGKIIDAGLNTQLYNY